MSFQPIRRTAPPKCQWRMTLWTPASCRRVPEGIGGSHLSTKQGYQVDLEGSKSIIRRTPSSSHPHTVAPHLPFGPRGVAKARNSDSEAIWQGGEKNGAMVTVCKNPTIFLFGSFLWLKHKLKTASTKCVLASEPLTPSILNTIASSASQHGGWRTSATDWTPVCPEDGDWLLSL